MQDHHSPPTTASIALACALIAGATGYFLGQARSIGLFSGSISPTRKEKGELAAEADDSSDDEDQTLGDFEGNNEECKLVLVVRTDLGMTKGMKSS
jgi:peptidyl-tRNA hydrolase, PTH2 family